MCALSSRPAKSCCHFQAASDESFRQLTGLLYKQLICHKVGLSVSTIQCDGAVIVFHNITSYTTIRLMQLMNCQSAAYLAGNLAASAAACTSMVRSKSAAVYDEKMQSPYKKAESGPYVCVG